MTFSICIVDDDNNLLQSLRRTIEKERPDWKVVIHQEPEQALQEAKTRKSALYLSDYQMNGMTGVQFLAETKNLHPDSIRILFSGMATDSTLQEAINKAEVFRFISKPVAKFDLISALDQACAHHKLLTEHHMLVVDLKDKQEELQKKDEELDGLKRANPELFELNRDSDGAIVINSEDF